MMWVVVIGPNLSARYEWNVPYNVDYALIDHIDIYNGEYDRRSEDIHATPSQMLGSEALEGLGSLPGGGWSQSIGSKAAMLLVPM